MYVVLVSDTNIDPRSTNVEVIGPFSTKEAAFDWAFDEQRWLVSILPITSPMTSVEDGLRDCDECGRITDAGEFPDWVNGVCEVCDPEILNHPDNLERMV